MNDLPKNALKRPGTHRWGRFLPASVLIAVVLAGIGRLYFDGRQPDVKMPHSRKTASPSDSGVTSSVMPVQYEFEDGGRDNVVTASGAVFSPSPRQSGDSAAGENSAREPGPKSSDDHYRAAIVGEWEDEYHGKRHLTVREDGTGVMLVEPDGIGKRLFAAELKFDIEWILGDGRITMKMLKGEPKSKVQLILKLYGQEAEYAIIEMTDDRMLLQDSDGKTRYDWRRPASRGETSSHSQN